MLTGWQDEIDGWAVTGSIHEYRPDGWRPGDRIQYVVQAEAKLRIAFQGQFKEDSPHLLRFPATPGAAVYGASTECREAAMEELRRRIKSLKR